MTGAVAVIGMHRSGTSMTMRLLQAAGLFAGKDDHLAGPSLDNPEGFFENKLFVRINDGLLAHMGGSWDRPPAVVSPRWEESPDLAPFRRQAEDLARTFEGRGVWGWKDPRTTITAAFWKSIFPGIRYVISLRNPLDVARSLAGRNGFSIQRGADLWSRYTRDAFINTRGSDRCVISYEEFFDEAGFRRQMGALLKFCGLPMPKDLGALFDYKKGSLRHNRASGEDLTNCGEVSSRDKDLFFGLKSVLSPGAGGGVSENATEAACRFFERFDEANPGPSGDPIVKSRPSFSWVRSDRKLGGAQPTFAFRLRNSLWKIVNAWRSRGEGRKP